MHLPYIHHNPDIERCVLGTCALHTDAYSTIQHLLDDVCFHQPHHLAIYRAMRTVWQEGHPADAISLTAQLYADGNTEINGLPAAVFVTQLINEIHSPAHLSHWCLQLRELAARRMMLRLGTIINNPDTNVVETAHLLQEQINKALQIRAVSDWVPADAAAERLCKTLEDNTLETVNGISTTIPLLDSLNGGLRPGQLIVLGARPSVGKSAFACGIALQAALHGYHTAFVSMEMTTQELYARMLSMHCNIPYARVERPMPESGNNTMHHARDLAGLPLYFTDSVQLTVHDIRALAEQLQKTHGLHLLIVDYLQLIQEHADGKRSREQQISAISRGLKLLAMQLHIPVLALSQLNRESENRSNKRPTLSDLRESGAIEQDADVVMLLHSDWQSGIHTNELGESTQNQAKMIVSKWRNGKTIDHTLHFHGPTMRFTAVG